MLAMSCSTCDGARFRRILAVGRGGGAGAPRKPATFRPPRSSSIPATSSDDDMLDGHRPPAPGLGGPFAHRASELMGKMSRRTLLPGRPIPLHGDRQSARRRERRRGQDVYIDGGLTIVTTGAALQDGAVGDIVKIRNDDSGVTVVGHGAGGRHGAGERGMMRAFSSRLLICLRSRLAAAAAVRIKDVTSLRGARDIQLIGYGLVVGLQGTGDTLRNVPFTEQAIQSMLDRMGHQCARQLAAEPQRRGRHRHRGHSDGHGRGPAARRHGLRARRRDLADGRHAAAHPTRRTDGQVFATAQGAVSVTGFDAQGQAETVSQGVPTAGRISNGAIVELASPAPVDELQDVAGIAQSRLHNRDSHHRRDQRNIPARRYHRDYRLRKGQSVGRDVSPRRNQRNAADVSDRRIA